MNEITTKELEEKAKNKTVNIIDVREDEEVVQGKIPGAQHIPLGEIPDRLNEIDKTKHHYLICRSGKRSGRASNYLEKQGYNITNVDGGMLEWDEGVEK